MTPDEIIRALAMQRHPEGGHFVETWRDQPAAGGRGTGTAIYYLLQAGERSHWHRVDATEIWHWYAGAPLRLDIAADDDAAPESLRLGQDIVGGERPQHLVPAGFWQSAESLGAWTLVGCTVSPAFMFEGFTLAPPGWKPGG